jgi:hypothetical protein
MILQVLIKAKPTEDKRLNNNAISNYTLLSAQPLRWAFFCPKINNGNRLSGLSKIYDLE